LALRGTGGSRTLITPLYSTAAPNYHKFGSLIEFSAPALYSGSTVASASEATILGYWDDWAITDGIIGQSNGVYFGALYWDQANHGVWYTVWPYYDGGSGYFPVLGFTALNDNYTVGTKYGPWYYRDTSIATAKRKQVQNYIIPVPASQRSAIGFDFVMGGAATSTIGQDGEIGPGMHALNLPPLTDAPYSTITAYRDLMDFSIRASTQSPSSCHRAADYFNWGSSKASIIIGANNASPVVLTVSGTWGITNGSHITIDGFTGAWAGLNRSDIVATVVGASTFSVPVDTTTWGTPTGTEFLGISGSLAETGWLLASSAMPNPIGGVGFWMASAQNIQGAVWIDGATKHGVLMFGVYPSGDAWYGHSPWIALNLTDPGYGGDGYHAVTRVGALYTFDPAQLAEVAAGTRSCYSDGINSVSQPDWTTLTGSGGGHPIQSIEGSIISLGTPGGRGAVWDEAAKQIIFAMPWGYLHANEPIMVVNVFTVDV
jgi:hypothetical protein